MSMKQIPARTEMTCDGCGILTNPSNRRRKGRLIVKQDGLDMLGNAVCDGSIERDLCDECLDKVCKAINDATA